MGPRGRFYPYLYHCDYIRLLGTGFMHVFYLGRAPHTKETLPDFLKWRRVTRHPLVFRGLTGSQRTPRFGVSQFKCFETEITAKSSLRIFLTIYMALRQRITQVGKDPYLLEFLELHQISVHA